MCQINRSGLLLGLLWCPHAEQGHHDPSTGHQTAPREKIFVDEELTNLIDPILNMDDTDGDGYIDYPEFVKAQQKAAAAAHNTGKPTWARYVLATAMRPVGIDNKKRKMPTELIVSKLRSKRIWGIVLP